MKTVLSLLVLALSTSLSIATAAENSSSDDGIVTVDVVPSTLAHIRNDWSLIFPLKGERLMLVWCEYYSTKPSDVAPERLGQDRYSDPDPCRISAKISFDQGRSWGDTFTLQDNIAKLNVKHPNLLRLSSDPKRILFFFTKRISDGKEIRVLMKESRDECENWTEPVQISTLPGVHFLMADRILQLSSGRIILPVFQSNSWFPFDAFCYYSDDAGKTWQTSKTKMKLPDHGAQEPSIVQLKDGSLLAVLRTSLGTVYQSHSRDEGENWTKPTSTGLPAPASTPLLKRIPSTGDLLLIWNNFYDPKHPEFQAGHGPRNPLTVAISKDEGKTWGNFKDLENRPASSHMSAAVTFVGDKALVTYATQNKKLTEHSKFSVRLKIIPVDWFYRK